MTMNSISQAQKHITILAVFYIGLSLVGLAISISLFLLLSGIGIAVDEPIALRILVSIGTAFLCLSSIASIPSLIAGIGLLARRSWGRILALILAVFKLFNIPIGTVVGVYAFWVLMQDEVEEIFSSAAQSIAQQSTNEE